MQVVVGFLSYDDFVDELGRTRIGTVRVQHYHRRSTQVGLPYVSFFVEAATARGDEVLVCRFRLGGGADVGPEREHRNRDEENARTAARLIAEDLTNRGYTVRPGIIAATQRSETVANPDGLWHFEKADDGGPPLLVANPEEPEERPAAEDEEEIP